MPVVTRRAFAYKFFPFCWTVLIIFLLCMPGSLVPSTGIFTLPHLDKYVHVFLFGMHVLLWSWHYVTGASLPVARRVIVANVLFTIALGVALEYVQGSGWVSNRTFDVYDIVADSIGAVAAGLWLFMRTARRPNQKISKVS